MPFADGFMYSIWKIMHSNDTVACDQRCPNLFLFSDLKTCDDEHGCKGTEECLGNVCLSKFFTH